MKASSKLVLLLLIVLTASFVPSAVAQSEENAGSRKVLNRVDPVYPSIARTMNLTGAVKLEAVVTSTGSVKSIHILGGNPVFAAAAENAVRAWKWEKNDHDTTETIEVRFTP